MKSCFKGKYKDLYTELIKESDSKTASEKVLNQMISDFKTDYDLLLSKINYKKSYPTLTVDSKINIVKDFKPITQTEVSRIKPGVPELFESNPELANAVYEALGYMRVYRTGEYNPDDKTFFVSPSKGTWDKYFKGEVQELFTKKLYLPLTNKTFTSFKELRDKYDRGEFTDKDVANIYPEESGIQNFEQYEISPQDIVSADVVKQQAQQQYSQYLDTIFPDSQVKDIVYHGTNKQFDKFELGYTNTDGKKTNTEGFHFIAEPGKSFYRERYGNLLSVLLDIKNPVKDTRYEKALEYLSKRDKAVFKSEGYDSGIKYFEDKDGEFEYVVFEPEQIHILGSKQDIEGFKEFVKKGTNKEENKSLADKVLDELKSMGPILDFDNIKKQDYGYFIPLGTFKQDHFTDLVVQLNNELGFFGVRAHPELKGVVIRIPPYLEEMYYAKGKTSYSIEETLSKLSPEAREKVQWLIDSAKLNIKCK